jgi:hypothetical protein
MAGVHNLGWFRAGAEGAFGLWALLPALSSLKQRGQGWRCAQVGACVVEIEVWSDSFFGSLSGKKSEVLW